jgi:hypothetical protein
MDKTIDMAREAGFETMRGHGLLPHVPEDIFIANACVTEEVNRLVALVRADEREACAKFCETHQVWVGQGKRGFSEWGEDEFVTGGIHQGMDYAAAIRARGNT